MRTVCGGEFQTDGAENWKPRLAKSVLMNGWSSSGMADEVQLDAAPVVIAATSIISCSSVCLIEIQVIIAPWWRHAPY